MRKLLIASSLLLISGVCATARSLTPAEALGRVPGMAMSRSTAEMTPVMTFGSEDAPTLYVFSRDSEGWMIVSADDVAAPLLGYSDTGSFTPDALPENFSGWITMYDEQISAASAAGALPYRASRSGADRTPIEPLVKTIWNQNSPFNRYCPGGNTYTGCVATAMAQVMKYFNWPAKAGDNAVFNYTVNGVNYQADLSGYEFEWDKMQDSYKWGLYQEDAADAVAKLMQACAYSVRMRFGTTASAAYSEQVGGALVTYYNYDRGLHNEFRNLYSSSVWEDMIYANLRHVGPMVYWGGVHCFVCDGYSSDGYFHFNWGWGGISDGYFLLSALAPGAGGIGSGNGDYTPNQGALLGARPATDGESAPVYTFRIDELTSATVSSAIGLTIYGKFVNWSPYTVSGEFIFQVYDIDGKEQLTTCPVYSPGCKNWGVDVETGNSVVAPRMMGYITGVPDGEYRVYPAVRIDGKEYSFLCPPTIAGYVVVTIENGNPVKVEIPEAGQLMVEDLNTYGDFFAMSYFKFSGVAKFTGNGDATTAVVPVLMRADGSVSAYSTGNVTLTFSPDGTRFEYVLPWFYEKGQTVEAGDYTFGIAKIENGQYITLGSCPVKVNDYVVRPAINTPISLTVKDASAVNPESVSVSATVEGTAGVFYQELIFTVIKGMTTVKQQSVTTFVSAGQTTEVNLELSLPNAKPGEEYYVYASRNNGGRYDAVSGSVYFTIGDSSALTEIGADSDAAAEYFNLQGQRVDATSPLTPGIYIRRQGNDVTKVLIR